MTTTPQPTYWMPAANSTFAPSVDWLFHFTLWVSVVFFVLIAALLAVFVVKYRRRDGVSYGHAPHHSTFLEVFWSVVPLFLVAIIFWYGFTGYLDLKTAPRDTYNIRLTAYKWGWFFEYPNGHRDPNLHVPVNTPVKITMTSDDVIHSLFIPAFRVKQDAVPGRYTELWFRAIGTGEFQIFCTEYCGTNHSNMLAKATVHTASGFAKWLDEAGGDSKLPPAEWGQKLYAKNGCTQCHAIDGSRLVGPSPKGLYGVKEHLLESGEVVAFDDNYIRESILNPTAKVAKGFGPVSVMPPYQGKLKDAEITALIEYFKTLK